jgi:phosphoribosylformimino-5-aminoimidazole carboxamide ribotide isomerase
MTAVRAPFTVVPAIDLRAGKCVRLRQGEANSETIYGDDPALVASRFVDDGARWLHVVDLDGAFAGKPVHQETITRIVTIARASGARIEVGGGLRDLGAIEAVLHTGASFVMLGTAALRDPALVEEAVRRFPAQIAVGIDARAGRVSVAGWTETGEVLAHELARRVEGAGVSHIVFTDIARDGMMTGPNVEATRALARTLRIPVFASGGVGCADDVRALAACVDDGVAGVIVGRALYDGRVDLAAVLREVASGSTQC